MRCLGMEYDLHHRKRTLRTRLESLVKDKDMIPKNKQLIRDFDDYAVSTGMKECRRAKYLTILSNLSKWLNKDFNKATKKDILKLVAGIEDSDKKEWTKVTYKVVLKRFYRWFKGKDEFNPDEVRWIKASMKREQCKLPEELLSEEEVNKMAQASSNPRDKAIVQCLYETGCRIGELLTIRIGNIKFDEYGAVLHVRGKTGDRRIRIVASAPVLSTWLEHHPYREDPRAFVWIVRLNGKEGPYKPYMYAPVLQLVKRLAVNAGIKKRIYPHLFRHSRATALANKLTEAQMKAYFGWVQDSDMAGVYVHLSGRDVDDALLKIYGMKKDEKTEAEKFRPSNCSRCKTSNSPASKFCVKCGCPLSYEAAIKADQNTKKANNLMNTLMKDAEFKEIILKKIMERGLEKDLIGTF